MAEIQYNAAAYLRLSKEDGDTGTGKKAESNSISNQKQLILDYVKDRPELNLISIRIDDGYTGTNFDRPDFQRMMDDIKAGRVNCVIVKDLSRFGREYINAGKYIDRLFPYYGVRLISINDGIDTITQDSSDNFNIILKNLMNDNYCRDISIKIRSQLQVKRKNGEYLGAFAPYGYRKKANDRNALEIDEYAAEVVRDIFRWKIEGQNTDYIARRLSEQGVLSPMEYKRSQGLNYKSGFKTKVNAKWTPLAVRRILTNPIYVGTMIQGVRGRPNYKIKQSVTKDESEWVVVENAHDPIVSFRSFKLVQRLQELDTRTSPEQEKVFPLSGLIVCGDCGGAMVRKINESNGKKFVYYLCSTNKKTRQCSPHRISEEQLLQVVLTLLQKHIAVIAEMNECIKAIEQAPLQKIRARKVNERIGAVEVEIERFRRLKMDLYEDMHDGIITEEDFTEMSFQYEERISEAKLIKDRLQNELLLNLQNEELPYSWMQEFVERKNIDTLTRAVAVECIEKIAVYEDHRIEVEFAYAQDYAQAIEQLEEYNRKYGTEHTEGVV